jgi:hypothetical protein
MLHSLTRTQFVVAYLAIFAIAMLFTVLILAHAAKRQSRKNIAEEKGENTPRIKLDR